MPAHPRHGPARVLWAAGAQGTAYRYNTEATLLAGRIQKWPTDPMRTQRPALHTLRPRPAWMASLSTGGLITKAPGSGTETRVSPPRRAWVRPVLAALLGMCMLRWAYRQRSRAERNVPSDCLAMAAVADADQLEGPLNRAVVVRSFTAARAAQPPGGRGADASARADLESGVERDVDVAAQHAPGQGALYVVATPIGNLGDITARAVDVLRQVDLIATEDTRHSGVLLQRLAVATPTKAYHDHSGPQATQDLLGLLRTGQQVALITDAGTPLISDPGYKLVQRVRACGIPVIPVPGACALTAALCASGLPTDRFAFEGFLPAKQEVCSVSASQTYSPACTPTHVHACTHPPTHSLTHSLCCLCGKKACAIHVIKTLGNGGKHLPLLVPLPFLFL